MPIPELIPIARIENYHTHNLGIFDNGKQFMGFVVAACAPEIPGENLSWQEKKKWYAVLHTFDRDGNHIKTQAWYAGTTFDGEQKAVTAAKAKLTEYLIDLGPIKYQSVKVKLFEATIDGHLFALQKQDDEDKEEEADLELDFDAEDSENVTLVPNDLVFYDPWDGNFDT